MVAQMRMPQATRLRLMLRPVSFLLPPVPSARTSGSKPLTKGSYLWSCIPDAHLLLLSRPHLLLGDLAEMGEHGLASPAVHRVACVHVRRGREPLKVHRQQVRVRAPPLTPLRELLSGGCTRSIAHRRRTFLCGRKVIDRSAQQVLNSVIQI
jgi:hypothetical protein